MNNSYKDDLEKTCKKFGIAVEIYEKAYDLAIKFVDDKTTYGRMFELAILGADKIEVLKCREEAISAITANILTISDFVRL